MKLRVQNIQGLDNNFTVTVNSDSDLVFKGTSYLYVKKEIRVLYLYHMELLNSLLMHK